VDVDPSSSLTGARVTLRPVVADDAPSLAEMLAEPEVARWWPGYDLERVARELVADEPAERHYVIELEGRVIGFIQSFEEEDADFRHASIDLFLASREHRKGLGADAIRVLAGHLVDERGHHRLTIDPAADNLAAISAYQKVGFRPVGVMRQYQRLSDGRWVDGLLMELLSGELVR
jgi:aminoglycoside 6'-N-acetyltransferase